MGEELQRGTGLAVADINAAGGMLGKKIVVILAKHFFAREHSSLSLANPDLQFCRIHLCGRRDNLTDFHVFRQAHGVPLARFSSSRVSAW